ncbi:hypothetical protein BZG21_46540, partial [Escherichia coli]|nr:hypothetical protein [Escherichia coli]
MNTLSSALNSHHPAILEIDTYDVGRRYAKPRNIGVADALLYRAETDFHVGEFPDTVNVDHARSLREYGDTAVKVTGAAAPPITSFVMTKRQY